MGLLGAVGSAVGSFLGSNAGAATISGLFNSRDVDKTNQVNKEIAQMNLGFQRENLDYQKALQQQIFDREDSAYSRTVQDMRNAGLSPLSMQNTNGAGEAIATSAPEMNYQRQRKDYTWIGQAYQSAVDGAYRYLQMKKQNEMADAQIANVNADTASKLANNDFFKLVADYRLKNLQLSNDHLKSQIKSVDQSTEYTRLQSVMQQYLNQDYKTKNSWSNYFGLSSDMSTLERGFAIGLKALGLDFKNLKKDDLQKIRELFNLFGANSTGSSFPLFPQVGSFLPSLPSFGSDKKQSETDKRILEKVDKGVDLTPYESFLYWLMKNEVK